MTPTSITEQPSLTRVSILARIAPALSCALPAVGAAISALLFIGVMRAMRMAASAGIAAVAAGITEANVAILVSLYLGIVIGLAGIVVGLVRMFSKATTTASPSAWFFVITGVLGFVPMMALWRAQSLLLDVLFSRSGRPGGVAAVASEISLLLIITLCAGAISVFIILVASVVPLPAILRAKRKWAPPVILIILETLMIVMTVAYHVRTAWLYSEYQRY
jgi:hypothetical protein